ncbi:hypothetical protein [Nonomuraea wenchangensis]|uniref:Uncharacterized protein n=1 Tax=Nonomuraea wenchangensis TaxID=568860 RepID=A0A1I0KTP9_9ACTN|nr:hypothetical protein [Nonomuraea wenchangensis]SEU29058.1 hypothetical protein SAMN05421811_109315 [Nonomuraea wenchangensis]
MPKLRSVIAGLAIGTAMTGGAVAASAATSAASAATQVSTGTTVATGWGCGHRSRCGWGGWGGWRRGHHQRTRVNVDNNNFNFNRTFNNRREIDRRFHRHHHNPMTGYGASGLATTSDADDDID